MIIALILLFAFAVGTIGLVLGLDRLFFPDNYSKDMDAGFDIFNQEEQSD